MFARAFKEGGREARRGGFRGGEKMDADADADEEEDDRRRTRREPTRTRAAVDILRSATTEAAAAAKNAPAPPHADARFDYEPEYKRRGDDGDDAAAAAAGTSSNATTNAKKRQRHHHDDRTDAERELAEIKKRMKIVSNQMKQMTRKQTVYKAVIDHVNATPAQCGVRVSGLPRGTTVKAAEKVFSRCGAVRRSRVEGAAIGGGASDVVTTDGGAVIIEFASATSVERAMKLATEGGNGKGAFEAFGGTTPTLTRGVGIVDDAASNSAALMRADARPFAAPKTPGGRKAKVWVRDAAATAADAPEAMIA
jgi:hypothetical protein